MNKIAGTLVCVLAVMLAIKHSDFVFGSVAFFLSGIWEITHN